jgi:molybdate transport system permease protein
MFLTPSDLQAIGLTLRVAALTTVILLILGTPLAWWLARSRSWLKKPIGAVLALPLVLPPSVLGFYLLVMMGPHGFVGEWTQALGLGLLTFTFWGLVAGSVLYSLPFMVQPIQNAMEAMGTRPLEVAASLRASKLDTFFNVVLPLCKPGLISGCIMSFAHTVGEFGVVLMVGGNIPGQTRTVAVQIYDHVEALEYASAHRLAAVMLAFSFAVLLALHIYNGSYRTNGKQPTSA